MAKSSLVSGEGFDEEVYERVPGVWDYEGNHLLEITQHKYGFNGDGKETFVMEFKVLESDNSSLEEGDAIGDVVVMGKNKAKGAATYFARSCREYLGAVMKCSPNEVGNLDVIRAAGFVDRQGRAETKEVDELGEGEIRAGESQILSGKQVRLTVKPEQRRSKKTGEVVSFTGKHYSEARGQ